MRTLSDVELFRIAKDILEERVITSNKIRVEFKDDEDAYLELLKSLFTVEAVKPYLPKLQKYVEENGNVGHVLWYGYLKDMEETSYSFNKAHVIMGEDYLKLIDCLTAQLLGQGIVH